MIDEKDFQKRVQKIGDLVQELEEIADPASRTAARQLVQLLMDLHGAGFERMLEVVFQSGDSGTQLIDNLGRDPLVSSLLILYGLHPEDLQTRVERQLKQVGSKLYKMGADANLVSANDGHIHVRARIESHGCGSTGRTVKTLIEEAIHEAAPDLKSLHIEGLEERPAGGFIAVEKLLDTSPHSAVSVSEGMD